MLHACVERYRLLGLENRLLDKRDFANDKVDAGELGSGQSACGGGPAARQKQVTSGKLRRGEPLSGARGSCVGMTPSSLSSAPNVLQLAEGVPTEALVLRARAGDRAAESLLYRRFARGVLSTAVRLVGSVSAGEDVVQDAFLICLGRLGQLKNPAHFRPWLLSIVVSLSSKRLRRERLLKWVGLDAVADAQLAVPERTELQHAWMSTWARSGRSWAEPEFATRPHRRLLERFTTRKPASPQLSVH